MKKRILGFISIVGVLGVTGWLIFSLLINSGIIYPEGKPVPANIINLGYWKIDFNYWKMEFGNTEFANFFSSLVEDGSHTKSEFPKVESEDPSPPNQPPAPIPPSSSTPTPESEPPFSPDCDPFEGMELSLVILSIREDIMVLPLYLKTEDGVIPELSPPPDDGQPTEFYAKLGNTKSNSCGLQQGFEDRLYCMFSITPDMPGSAAEFQLFLGDCEDPVFIQLYVSIPELKTQCTKDLSEADCKAAGGEMNKDDSGALYCDCTP
jgi:hypothetical protein